MNENHSDRRLQVNIPTYQSCKYPISVSFDRLMIERGQSIFTYLVITIQLFEYENCSINYLLPGSELALLAALLSVPLTALCGPFSENSPSKIFFDSGSVFLPYLHMKVKKQPMTNNNKWLLTFKTLVEEIIWVYESFQIQLNSCWEVNFMLFF